MTSNVTYLAALKARSSDVNAYNHLSERSRKKIKPLFEVPLRPPDCGLLEHIEKSIGALRLCHPATLFFDPYGLKPSERLADGRLAEIEAFTQVQSLSQHKIIPTYGLERSDHTWRELPAVVDGSQGFAFRLTLADVEGASDDTWEQILFRSARLNLPAGGVDIVLDLRHIANRDVDELVEIVVDFLANAPQNFRSTTILGSTARKDVTGIGLDDVESIKRRELQLWAKLRYEFAGTKPLGFGDYGVIHPDLLIAGPNKNANAKIRYTAGQRIYYFRGHGLYVPKVDFDQYHDLARKVASSNSFCGRDFSWGDSELMRRAERACGPGNLATWITIDTNHHLSAVVKQLEFLSERIDTIGSQQDVDALVAAL